MTTVPAKRPRELPMRRRPLPRETLVSYLRRLADANHLTPQFLHARLRGTRVTTRTTLDITLLAAAAGMAEHALRQALPELRHASGEVVAGFHNKVVGFSGEFARPACRRYAAARGVFDAVDCWATPAHNVCLIHHLWIGPSVLTPADQFDVSGVPDLGRAQRRQIKLRNLDDFSALFEAEAICQRWSEGNRFTSHRDQRLAILAPSGKPSAAVLHAAIFPEIISMAAMLSTPRWRALAHGTRPEDLDQLYAEVSRRIRHRYEPAGVSDAFVLWIREQNRPARRPPPQRHTP